MVKPNLKKKMSMIQALLTLIFVVAYVVSNVITAKQLQFPFGITMTGAVFTFPITYVLSDMFSEVYGYKWSRITCYLAFLSSLFATVIFQLVIITPAPAHWTGQEAFVTTLGASPRILASSVTAFVLGDFVNDRVFRRMKRKHDDMKGFAWRAILSSLCGETVDCAVFLPLAFIGTMPLSNLVIMAITQVFLKTGYEVVIIPLTTFVTKKVLAAEQTIV